MKNHSGMTLWIATDNLDTSEPLIILVFIFCRWHLSTPTVIKHFDVIKNIAAGFFRRSVDFFLYQITLQQLEKAFCNRVIMAVTATAHAAPSVRVISGTTATHGLCTDCTDPSEPVPVFGGAPPYSHQQCVQDDVLYHLGLHWPADNFAWEQINNHGKIQPAFVSPDVGLCQLPNAHPERPDWTVPGACRATQSWPRLYVSEGSGIRPELLFRHVSSVARHCCPLPCRSEITIDTSRFQPELFLSVLSISHLPDGVVNAAAEARSKSHWDEHPAPDKAGEQARNRCCRG